MTEKTLSSYTATYEYRYGSMLYSVDTNFLNESDVTFEYGGDGKRRSRTSNSVTTGYRWNGLNIVNEEDDIGDLERTYVSKLAHIDGSDAATGTYNYYAHDHLGSPRSVHKQGKNPIASADFSPFGIPYARSGSEQALKFAGYYWENALGDYMMPFRKYSPAMARFTSRDPLMFRDGPNRYAYTENNPVNAIDPLGLYSVVAIDEVNKTVTVTLPIRFHGPEANPANVAKYVNAIQNTWKGTVDGYSFQVLVEEPWERITPGNQHEKQVNYVCLYNGSGATDDAASWDVSDPNDLWVAAHEAGHFMGLLDEYLTTQERPRKTVPVPGYAGSIMAEVGGTVWDQHLKEIKDGGNYEQPWPPRGSHR